jgi:molybdopterin molybdotransferase
MIEFESARSLVLEHVQPGAPIRAKIDRAMGRVLADDVRATADSPPYDKSMFDGYAIRSSDASPSETCLTVIETVAAGQTPTAAVGSGQAVRIMTGAVLPAGADCVIPVEKTELRQAGDGEQIRFSCSVHSEANVQRRGQIARRGDVILSAGKTVRPLEIGLLAEFGVGEIRVFPAPRVAVLPTGDELVDFEASPGPGQIRNSNGPMLNGLLRSLGVEPVDLGIGRDRYDDLCRLVRDGLSCDILILSGGVSMGQKDLVPQVLHDLNVKNVFHRVRLRPGKPVWFGIGDDNDHRTLVFGLPGNPVSSFVCFQLLVRPAIERLMGHQRLAAFSRARLHHDHAMLDERPTLSPVRRVGLDEIETLPWQGSSDQVTMANADGLVFFRKAGHYKAGDILEVLDFNV